jgi:hypothetical protein
MNEAMLLGIVKFARGLDPAAEVDPVEEWDSLDHLTILAKLYEIHGPGIDAVEGIAEINNLGALEEKLRGAGILE